MAKTRCSGLLGIRGPSMVFAEQARFSWAVMAFTGAGWMFKLIRRQWYFWKFTDLHGSGIALLRFLKKYWSGDPAAGDNVSFVYCAT